MENDIKIEYYRRGVGTGVYVRVIDEIILEYLNPECEWSRNQEWLVEMFYDGAVPFTKVTEEEVDAYIESRLTRKSGLSYKRR